MNPDAQSTSPLEVSEATIEAKRKLALNAAKAKEIRQACSSRDVEALIHCATTEGGLLEDELRQVACESHGHIRKTHLLTLFTQGPSSFRLTRVAG